MNISIIIVNYNSASDVEVSLRSIYQELHSVNFDVFLVDNNSPERIIENLPAKFPLVNFFFLKENLGFAKANNYAFKKTNSEFTLFLNPDTIFTEDCVTPLIKFIGNNTSAGACSPKLLNEDKSFQFSFGKKLGFIYEAAEALMLIGLYRKLYLKSISEKFKNGYVKVDWLSGAFLLMKSKVFKQAGMFSEDFFLNYEDIDLCEIISKNGFTNYYFPSHSCIHLDSKSQKKNYEAFVLNRYKSRLLYAKKHYSLIKQVFVKFIHLTGLVLRILTVNFLYEGEEKKQRSGGYKKSFYLYIKP